MELLFCIIRQHRLVEEVLTGFLDIGIHGATVMDAKGMGEILTTQVPIFAGFKSMFPVGGGHSYVIMSVVEEESVDVAIQLIEEVVGDFDEPGAGVLFTVPLTRVKGLAGDL
jgi:nitrogen regulatory protein PII